MIIMFMWEYLIIIFTHVHLIISNLMLMSRGYSEQTRYHFSAGLLFSASSYVFFLNLLLVNNYLVPPEASSNRQINITAPECTEAFKFERIFTQQVSTRAPELCNTAVFCTGCAAVNCPLVPQKNTEPGGSFWVNNPLPSLSFLRRLQSPIHK